MKGKTMFTPFQLFILASIGLMMVVLSLVLGGRASDALRIIGMVLLVVSLYFSIELARESLAGVEVVF